MELRLQKGSIKATRQKVNDILGIPTRNTKLQDLYKRPDNDPFIAEWEAQYNDLGKPTPRAIASQMSGTTKADFIFKINFLTLYGSTMGTLENGGRVPKKLVKCIKEETDILDIDWCGYILDCLHDNKHNWEKLLYLDSTFFPDLNIIRHRPAIRSWNTPMMRKRIMVETSKGYLGNLEHHEDFDPDEDQNGIDLYKGLDVYIEPLSERKPVTNEEFYEKIIEKFTKISEESESESDADNNNKKNDDEEEKEKRNDISKGTEEAGREQKDDEEDDQDDLNNEHEFEKLTGDDREVAFSMEVDETENEKEKQTENVKEQQAEKEKEKQAENEEKQDDIGKGTEEARSETKNDGEEVHAKVDDPNEQMKDKEADKQKVNDGNENEKDKQDEHNHLTQDEFWNKEYDLTDSQCEKLEYQATQNTKKKKTTKRKSPEDMTPLTFSLGLTPEESEPTQKEKEKHMEKRAKGLSPLESEPKPKYKEEKVWKKANGKYDEEKQFEAFSKIIKSEFKKDPKMKNMKDLEMAFFPIISHEHYYLVVFNFLKGNTVIFDNSKTHMTYDVKYKTVCELLKKLFSMHLEKVKHPKAKDVLNKKPTILRPK
ncbi:hypothetical protein Tco_0877688 [Tanacetum coccineum]|uniref:Ubiquitin-like protease family profile domain-containing protein n=1 Tax=Tanacetum coccineum TaxID=301880 RepID=A0ABQ5BYB0_9ASTR